jgi:hypothetical protein
MSIFIVFWHELRGERSQKYKETNLIARCVGGNNKENGEITKNKNFPFTVENFFRARFRVKGSADAFKAMTFKHHRNCHLRCFLHLKNLCSCFSLSFFNPIPFLHHKQTYLVVMEML